MRRVDQAELHEDEPNKEKLTIDIPVALTTSAPWLSCAPSPPSRTEEGLRPQGGLRHAAAGRPSPRFGDGHAWPGSVFRVPVTVIKPHADLAVTAAARTPRTRAALHARPHRAALWCPAGATWATVVLEVRGAPRSREADGGQTIFMLHTTQLLPSKRIQEWSTRVSLGLPKEDKAPSTQYVHSVAVTGGVTMEVTVAQWWARATPRRR